MPIAHSTSYTPTYLPFWTDSYAADCRPVESDWRFRDIEEARAQTGLHREASQCTYHLSVFDLGPNGRLGGCACLK